MGLTIHLEKEIAIHIQSFISLSDGMNKRTL